MQTDSKKAPASKERKLISVSDFYIILFVFLLIAIGVCMVYDSSYYISQRESTIDTSDMLFEHYDPTATTYLKSQLWGFIMGLAGMLIGRFLDYRFWTKNGITILLLIGSLLLMVAVWIPGIGVEVYGAHRWIKIGSLPQIQPSEVAKFALIVFLARFLAFRKLPSSTTEFKKKHEKSSGIRRFIAAFIGDIVPILPVPAIFIILLAFQPNMSMLITYVALVAVMLMVDDAKWSHLIVLALLSIVLLGIAYLTIPHFNSRINEFFSLKKDETGDGFQALQSLFAISKGGLFGTGGFGSSSQKFERLPFASTDFIFSIIAEEYGFFGAAILIILYWLLMWRCWKVYAACNDKFGRLLSFGITAMITIQAIINIGVTTRVMPTTGLPLPFVSQGGTSLAIFMTEIGVILNISRNNGTYKLN